MPPPPIPPDVQAFILRHLPTVGHLEILLWTREHRGRWWNAGSIASTLGLPVPVGEKILEDLCSANLLAVQVSSTVSYQFSPATPAIEALVTEFVEVLRHSRVRVYGLIASPSARSLKDFADAFKFRDKHRG